MRCIRDFDTILERSRFELCSSETGFLESVLESDGSIPLPFILRDELDDDVRAALVQDAIAGPALSVEAPGGRGRPRGLGEALSDGAIAVALRQKYDAGNAVFLTISEAAALLNVHPVTIHYKLRKNPSRYPHAMVTRKRFKPDHPVRGKIIFTGAVLRRLVLDWVYDSRGLCVAS